MISQHPRNILTVVSVLRFARCHHPPHGFVTGPITDREGSKFNQMKPARALQQTEAGLRKT